MDLGNKPAGTVVRFFFNTYDSAGALVTASSLAASDVEIYKAGSTTQRASDNGITVTVDFDGVTGLHMVAIDLTDDSDSGFYAVGSDYAVSLGPFTVDTQTVGLVRSFRIVAAEVNSGFPQVDTRRLWDFNNAEYVEPGIDSSSHGITIGNVAGGVEGTIGAAVWARNPNDDGYSTPHVTYALLALGIEVDTQDLQTNLAKVPKSDGTVAFNATAVAGIQSGLSTLTQAQVTGGAYALNSASFAFNSGLDFTTTQKAATLARVTLTDTATTLTNAPSDSAGVGTLLTRLSSARAGYLDNVNNAALQTTVAQTGDSFARLGAPAGASHAADIAAIQADLPARITKNTALANFPFKMTNTAGTALTGLTITATRSIDGAAFGACANSATEISDGWYKIDLAAGDLNGNNIVLRFTGTGAKATEIQIVTQST